MKKGDVVKVYQKPYTKEDFEGMAKLKRFMSSDSQENYENWMVEFTDEPGAVYHRKIYTK